LVAVVALLVLAAVSFSEEQAVQVLQNSPADPGIMHQDTKIQQGHRKDKYHMSPMMMKSMMEKTMVATEDGGVVVLIGNKLLKYDKNLNLQKEVEIKIDTEAIKEKMMQMKQMHKKCSGINQEENKKEAPAEP
jgi:Na+/H+ antiporter NhaB